MDYHGPYGPYTQQQIEAKAIEIFDNGSRLYPNNNGKGETVLVRVGDGLAWATDGYDKQQGGWVVRHIDPSVPPQVWPPGQVYDPYDFKKLAYAAAGAPIPVRDHEDPDKVQAMVTKALQELAMES